MLFKTWTRHRFAALGKLAIAVFACCIFFISADALAFSKDNWLWPVPSDLRHMSRGYYNGHSAIDCSVAPGTTIRASKGGKVLLVYSGCNSYNNFGGCTSATCSPNIGIHPMASGYNCNWGFGNGVVLKHADGSLSAYAHMSSVSVKQGAEVKQGDTLGKSGSAGASYGPHLHFMVSESSNGGTYPFVNLVNNNPYSPDYRITSGEKTNLSVNGSGYVYNTNGLKYIFTPNEVSQGPVISAISTKDDTISFSWNTVPNAVVYSIYAYASQDAASNAFIGRKLSATSGNSFTIARSALGIGNEGGTFWFCIVAEGSGANNFCFGARKSAAIGKYTPCSHENTKTITVIEPGCMNPGKEQEICSDCSLPLYELQISPLGHDSGAWEIVTEALKDTAGLKELRCTRCNELLRSEEIPAWGILPCGHGYADAHWVEARTATCLQDGREELHCGICDTIAETQVVPATGHSEGEWISLVPAGCISEGNQQRLCENCGIQLETRSVPALNHSYAWKTVYAATATKTGLKQYACTRCSAVSDYSIIELSPAESAFSTIFSANITDTSATIRGEMPAVQMVKAGYYIGTSADNLVMYSENVNASAAIMWYDINVSSNNYKWKPALKPGTTYYYKLWYSTASATYTSGLHSFTTSCSHGSCSWKDVKAATCTVHGLREKICSSCGRSIASEATPLLPHVPAPAGAVQPANASADGLFPGIACAHCSTIFSKPVKIHRNAAIFLPAALNELESEALYGLKGVEQLSAQPGLRSIGSKALANCSALRIVALPASVNFIAPDAFEDCTNMILLCPEGSYAHQYALDHGIPTAE